MVHVIRRNSWIALLVVGLVFVGGGMYMLTEGLTVKDEVRDAVFIENVVTSEDTSIPDVLVGDVDTAKAESEVDREDTSRETAFRTVQLRTSLNPAVMGFRISDLVSIFMIVIGTTSILFVAPAAFYSAQVANHYDELVKQYSP